MSRSRSAAPRIASLTSSAGGAIRCFDERTGRVFDRWLRGRPGVDRLMYGASAVGDHGLVWMIAAVAQGLRREDSPTADRQLLRALVGIAAESAVVNGPVKLLFRRTRPVQEGVRPHALRTPRSSSFPSGHATSAFFSATLLRDGDPLWPLYYAAAVIVAASRVHVNIHHASDVVGGVVLGIVMGELTRRLVPL